MGASEYAVFFVLPWRSSCTEVLARALSQCRTGFLVYVYDKISNGNIMWNNVSLPASCLFCHSMSSPRSVVFCESFHVTMTQNILDIKCVQFFSFGNVSCFPFE